MAEIYNEDLIEYLGAEQSRINNAINAIRDLMVRGSKYTASAKTSIVDDIKESVGSRATDYEGNQRPE